ncbi:MAG: flagellar hook-associated protein FlgK [Candidatus Nanopelagicales bacterium]
MGTFDGLSVALSGLAAQRTALDVAGQNIANANTDGYSRQRVLMTSVGAPAVAGIWSGRSFTGGVSVTGVDRLRDALLETRGQQAHGALSDLSASEAVIGQVEQLFPEPSDNGLAAALSDMWSAFHDVANQPGDTGTRNALLQSAATVTDWLNETSARLTALSGDVLSQARTDLDQVNALAGQIADLNVSIMRARDGQMPTNELADQRDLLAMKLADLVGGVATVDTNDQMRVMVGGMPLVEGDRSRAMALNGSGSGLAWSWAADGSPVQATGGELKGFVSAITSSLPAWSARLDSVASALATSVNALHGTGFDLDGAAGGAFFTGTTAATIGVAVTDPRKVAASAVAPGAGGPSLDAGVATSIAKLAASATGADSVYHSLVADVAQTSQTVSRRVTTQGTVASTIDTARESQAGVNVDEEMASILTFQRAYEASSRVLNAVDQMLDTLINRTGMVGR